MSCFLNSLSNRTFPVLRRCFSSGSACIQTRQPKGIVVTVLDVSSAMGSNLALLLKQNPNITELRIFDDDEDCYEVYKSLSEIDTKIKIVPFAPTQMREAITYADVVVSVGGVQKKPCQSQRGLFEKNVDNVRNAAVYLAEFNPHAVYCVAKPPIEALIPMVSEEYKKAEVYDSRKILGVTAIASMIANTIIARHLNKDPAEVLCPIIGGLSPKTTIPVISQTKPNVEYNVALYSQLREEIANAEEKLLEKGGNLCFSQVVAIARFVNSVVKALKGDQHRVECAYVAQLGHIGEFLPYMTSIIKLGRDGIASTHMPKINEQETSRLKSVMSHILENILLGQTFVSGDFSALHRFNTKRKCDVILKQKLQESRFQLEARAHN